VIAARVAAALGDAVALVVADAGRTSAEVVAELRATRTDERDSVLLLIRAGVSALDRAMLRAAIGPLAIELAPSKRFNGLDIADDAADDDVVAAAKFLAAATSTTGQILEARG
jgi:hypothetical protein